ncbi:MAG TPA: GIY-YIG nuclease family protein [Ignavibacteriaceae bacterium]|nr:GIY-YIG nuclease family protein [Ignavibacteriaceae bacterium]HRN27507.1 GIY-YIG nuclease family protein [Ignavibacteriaceae bacterium]HRP94045.1 GIY-YIG nuclease family protein [Ignavibacteriaceae bacterium]HRQ54445.1 GIY-YIG nuclease family protein [Ignavibacteriaceae bacterium]
MKNYCIYILTNKNNIVLYVGVTNNLTRRIWEHKSKLIEGFTKKYNVINLFIMRYSINQVMQLKEKNN